MITCNTACWSNRSVTVGIPNKRVPPLFPFGTEPASSAKPISTAKIGCGKYVPERTFAVRSSLSIDNSSVSLVTGMWSTPAEPWFRWTLRMACNRFLRVRICSIIIAYFLCSAYRKARPAMRELPYSIWNNLTFSPSVFRESSAFY